jgi:hypothetical protein
MRTLIVVLLAVWIVHAQDSTDKSTACRLYNECNEAIIFSDNFDELNTRRWKHEVRTSESLLKIIDYTRRQRKLGVSVRIAISYF